MKDIFKVILIGIFIFSACSNMNAQNLNRNKINTFFRERLAQAPYENHLVPYTSKTNKLSPSELKDVASEVWQIWKSVLNNHAKLPVPGVVTNNESPVVHQWDLINEDPMPFYFIKKNGENDGGNAFKKYSLYLNLHGSGPKEGEFKATLGWSLKYSDAPSIYFIPQIPNEKRYRWWYVPEQQAWEKLFRLAMVTDEINSNKIYVMGISEGGYGSQRLGAFYADYLAGAGPMAGGEPLENAPPLNFRDIAFSLQTGERDDAFGRNKYTALAKTAFDSLTKRYPGDFVHNIVLQKNRGHHIDYTQTTPWLSQFARNPNPLHISWVLFPVDGRYRKNFYNIGIVEPLDIDSSDKFDRAFFDIRFDKKKNLIFIQTSSRNKNLNEVKDIKEGKIAIYLNDKYVNLIKKVKVIYNGKVVYHAKPKLKVENIIESCAFYGDPYRLFPAKIEVKL